MKTYTTPSIMAHLISEYQDEMEAFEEMEENDEEFCQDDREDAQERLAQLEFADSFGRFLAKEGIEMELEDLSSVSEAAYFRANGVKVRIATHYSNYDKDVEIVTDNFRYGQWAHDSMMKDALREINEFIK